MDTTARILVETSQGVQNLKNLQAQLATTNQAFSNLKNAVLGFATAGFIANLYKMANELTDMAAATGVSTQAILGFSKAVSANGGSMEGATAGIAKFVLAIGDAASGSKATQDAFQKLGISLEDLRTLSEEELLKKTIAGFTEGMNASERLTLAVQLFGKTARSWDMSKINSELATYIAKSKESAAATEAAGEVSQRFSNAYKDLSTQILIALEPISKIALALLSFKEAMSIVIEYAVGIGSVILTFTALGKAMQVLRLIFAGAGEVFATVSSAIIGAGKGISGFGELISTLIKNIPGLAALGVGFSFLFDQVKKGLSSLGLMTDATKESVNADGEKANSIRDVKKAVDEFTVSLNKQIEAYQNSIGQANKKYEQETKNLGVSREQKAINDLMANAESEYLKEIYDLRDRYITLVNAGDQESLSKIPQVQAAIQAVTEAYTNQLNVIPKLAAAREAGLDSSDLEIFRNKQLAETTKKIKDIQEEMVMSTMSDQEKIYYQNQKSAEAIAEAALVELAAKKQIKREQLDPETVKQYYDNAIKGQDALSKQQVDALNKSRSFTDGWSRAFNQYVKDATNAADQAQRLFTKFAQGLEDAIVGFVKTGKFEWKNFVASMAEELLRSQIKATLADIMSIFSGKGSTGGGILGALGGLFGGGGAQGGQGASPTNPLYVLDISGGGAGGMGGILGGSGGGGGLLNTVWEGAKTVIGGIGSGIGTLVGGLGDVVTTIGSSIGNIFGGGGGGGGGLLDSIGSMFDGWFANGGTIGSGKFGIVGENGPELVSGPASVTPFGGTTNVTYNINAVDAMSFKAMVAADPSFIYAVTMQGAKSIPGRR